MSLKTDIRFPHLGINLSNFGTGITVFGVDIAFYGMIIALAMLCGYVMAAWMARRTKQNSDVYLDFALWAIIISVICARLYYVAFTWDEFKDNPVSILNLRSGGLAIYGGVIGAIITAIIYCRIKKYSFFLLADTGVIGLLTGQIIGRWGNFFNREAFGKYTDNLFAMQIDLRNVSSDYTCSLPTLAERYSNRSTAYHNILKIRENLKMIGGDTYLQVHPTFLYESLWNLILLIILFAYTKHKSFDGEIFLLYLIGYGLGRVWIEGLRTDQLFLWGTPFAVSQVLAGAFVLIGTIILVCKKKKARRI